MTWHKMVGGPGAHLAYADGNDLVVEWYDFGEDAPYESSNLLILKPEAQRHLAKAIGEDLNLDPDQLASSVASRFQSWFEVKEFLALRKIEAERHTDFMP